MWPPYSSATAAEKETFLRGFRTHGAGANLPRQSGGELLPPQLRKPNKVTEDVAGLRVAKRARE